MVLTDLLSGHTVSCGCIKRENHVRFTQREVDTLTFQDLCDCFLSTVDGSATKPDLPRRVITSAFIRYRDALKARLDNDLAGVRKRVLANRPYTDIAMEFNLHPAEVAWMAKHVIRPEASQQKDRKQNALNAIRAHQMGRYFKQEYLEKLERQRQSGLRDANFDYRERRRVNQLHDDRFSSAELHDPRTKASQEARPDLSSLDAAWRWMREEAPHQTLNSDEEGLLKWFSEAGDRTFQWRRDQRRLHAKQKPGKPTTVKKHANEPDGTPRPIEFDVAA